MAQLNFPSNPILGDTYTGDNGVTYTFDGVKWSGNTGSLTGNIRFNDNIIYHTSNNDLVVDPSNDTGDTGFVVVPGPTSANTSPLTIENQLSGGVRIGSNANYWNFTSTGTIEFPGGGSQASPFAGTINWNDVTNKPTFFSGVYDDLINKPNIPTNTNQLTNGAGFITASALSTYATQSYVTSQGYITSSSLTWSNISGKPTFATVATSGSYTDLTSTPNLSVYALTSSLSAVATSGSYTDLTNKPALFSGSYNDLTNKPVLFSGSYNDLTNKPALATVATSGSYTDLTNKPALFSGSYDDLTNKPTIPVVPTNVSAFSNDSGYLTAETDPTFTSSPAGGITSTQITNWDTAYGWGNHASAGYLTVVPDDSFEPKTGATGVVVHDCTSTQVFIHSSIANDFTVNLTNLNLAAGKATVITLMLNQGATPYMVSSLQIEGVAQSIYWQGGGVTPSGNSNKKDIVTLSIFNVSGTYDVLGQLVSFG